MLLKPLIIGICGGTCSGKSCLSKLLTEYYDAEYISQDNYFKDLSQFENRREIIKKTNFDCPDAYDIDLFIQNIKLLSKGYNINSPIYRFSDSTRIGTEHKMRKRIIVVDGIMMLYNDKIRDLLNYIVFIDCDDDIRLCRRIKRDIAERGYDLELILHQYFSTVKPMKNIYIDPYKSIANRVIYNNSNDCKLDYSNIINDINNLIIG